MQAKGQPQPLENASGHELPLAKRSRIVGNFGNVVKPECGIRQMRLKATRWIWSARYWISVIRSLNPASRVAARV